MEYALPYDEQLEKELVGSMLFEPECIVDAIETIKPEHFHHPICRKLCEEIFRLWNEEEGVVSVVSLTPFLEREQIPIEVVNEMTDVRLPSTKTIQHYGERLKAIAALRRAVQLGRQLLSLQHLKDRNEIREALNQAELQLSNIATATARMETMKPFEEVLREVNERFEHHYANGVGITGLKTGFIELDDMTSGFQKKDLIIIAGRPSMGKSALALEIAQYLRNEEKKNGIFFNLEMDNVSMAYRMIANAGHLDLLKLRSGMVSEEEYVKYAETLGYLADGFGMEGGKGKLWLDEQPGMTVAEMKAKARKIQREHGLDYLIIDYLGLIQGNRSYMNRVEEVSENSRLLKMMAKELDVPVIVLCQLSRAVEQRADKRPMLSDLRESGSIEQDADLVMFLYRDDYYHPNSDKANIAELIIAKHRNGPIGKVELLLLKNYNKFLSLTKEARESQ
ncbi:replicative DNA helicase [Laceyella sacchari]|uniref:Replicative DNA helicase n=1 Tax=Laceyella sacchari TaxID=37482 RepID=A0ABY5U8A3_LACSH|nr:replicative DNA helicase [Laceyella sacchari]UWE04880.1 replicative DNA helicase [Laceyella sacchari]